MAGHISFCGARSTCRPLIGSLLRQRQQKQLPLTTNSTRLLSRTFFDQDHWRVTPVHTQRRQLWSSPTFCTTSSLSLHLQPWLGNTPLSATKRQEQQQQQQLLTTSTMQIRFKHSQTQIKRIFKHHPARLRVEKRLWNIDRKLPKTASMVDEAPSTDVETSSSLSSNQDLQNPEEQGSVLNQNEELLYPTIYTPTVMLPNGWFEPMDATLRPKYPFHVKRTKNKPKDAIGFLPIYTKYRKDGTKVVTRIKKVTGDIPAFVRELRIVLNLPVPANQLQSYDAIKFRTGNMIEIHGHRANEIRKWLGGLGF